MMNGQTFDAGRLLAFSQALLQAAGMPADKAVAVADVLVDADLLGHETHGLQLLASYLDAIANQEMCLEGEPDVLADRGAIATWDGRRLPGAWLMLRAIEQASARARQFGMGAVSVRRSHHIGALATYARRVAEEGLVLLLMSSAPAGASVAPFGGTRAVFSPSPIAMGAPTASLPVLVDVSTSITTNTMASLCAAQGQPLPGVWLLDEQGKPTNDASVMVSPRKGTLQPLGGTDAGHKGYGLSLIVEAFTTGLAGHGRTEPGGRLGATLFVQVVDPAAFAGLPAFQGQMQAISDQCHDNPPVDAARPVRLPGERALGLRARQLAHGVVLNASIVAKLQVWADRLAVPLPPARP